MQFNSLAPCYTYIIHTNSQEDINMRTTLPKRGVGLLWSTRQISLYFSWAVIGFVTYFCSDYLGLNTAVVGTLILVSKILDAISNFVIAYIVDNTHMKLGRGRPWDLNIIPLWLMIILLFCIPASWGTTAKYAAIFICYTLNMAVFGTFLSCVDPIYFKHTFKDEETRSKVQVLCGGLSTIAMIVGSILMPILIDYFSQLENGWRKMAVIISIPMAILGIIRYLTIPETDTEEEQEVEHVTVKDTLRAFVTNKYVLLICLMYFALNVYNNFCTAPETYYAKWILGDISMQSLLSIASMAAIVILPFCIPMANKFGRIKVLRFFFLLTAISSAAKFFFGNNVIIICILQLIGGFVLFPFNAFSPLMLIDSMDYGHWNMGKAVEGAIFAATSLGSTIGAGVGSALGGISINAFGYDGLAAEQTARALFGIKFSFAIIPAIIMFVIFILLHFYDLDGKIASIREELEARRAQKQAENS